MQKTVQEAINRQINREFQSAYLYLAMSAYCEGKNLRGFAKWLRAQSKEELSHGMKLYDFLHDRNGEVVLQAIEAPPAQFKSVLDVFQQTAKHEVEVTKMIHALYELAGREKDYPTQVSLQWFLAEQVEEEKTSTQMVEQLKTIGDQANLIFLLDRELSARSE